MSKVGSIPEMVYTGCCDVEVRYSTLTASRDWLVEVTVSGGLRCLSAWHWGPETDLAASPPFYLEFIPEGIQVQTSLCLFGMTIRPLNDRTLGMLIIVESMGGNTYLV